MALCVCKASSAATYRHSSRLAVPRPSRQSALLLGYPYALSLFPDPAFSSDASLPTNHQRSINPSTSRARCPPC
ncbi:hypothetical protein BCR44DRAFT_1437786 [Catenaria anguillulae PL171]|uniref:Uncharacterized protein n=1 Tax=Catenaria anguillulae PL171 TaxID=765915 RepID=A0A1Y2HG84_9FUNG|nr:hypothetical protein BCR44DRAFT_1437786 [Catenaria anguillulae PL171]